MPIFMYKGKAFLKRKKVLFHNKSIYTKKTVFWNNKHAMHTNG